jgi:hypothetical protein
MLGDCVALKRDAIWYKELSVLFARNRLFEFWPHPMHTTTEKVNAIVRFSMYAAVACYLVTREPRFVVMGIAAIILVSLAHHRMPKDKTLDLPIATDTGLKNIREPTPSNPFGNALAATTAFGDGKTGPEPDHDPRRDEMFRKGLFMDFEDAWGKHTLERQFHTMPEQDPGAFAQYLYGDMDKSMETRARKTSHV